MPGRVAMFEVEERGSEHFLVSWDPPSEPNGVLTGFTIGYRLGMYKLIPTMIGQIACTKRHTVKL